MKLSIITVNYNNKTGLQQTIDSIVAQTWRDFEWIVVDGGSTDGSRELIEEYAEKGCFSWWCSEKDKGVYNAMNKGISHANGEYLNFMNSGDCFYKNDTLNKLFSNNVTSDIIYSDAYYTYSSKDPIIREKPRKISLNFMLHHALCHQSMLVKRRLFVDRAYDESLKIVSDWKHTLECLLGGCTFEYSTNIIASCNGVGISSNIEALNKERIAIIRNVIPEALRIDEAELDDWRCKEAYNPELSKIYYLLNKRRFFKKVIQGVIKVLCILD